MLRFPLLKCESAMIFWDITGASHQMTAEESNKNGELSALLWLTIWDTHCCLSRGKGCQVWAGRGGRWWSSSGPRSLQRRCTASRSARWSPVPRSRSRRIWGRWDRRTATRRVLLVIISFNWDKRHPQYWQILRKITRAHRCTFSCESVTWEVPAQVMLQRLEGTTSTTANWIVMHVKSARTSLHFIFVSSHLLTNQSWQVDRQAVTETTYRKTDRYRRKIDWTDGQTDRMKYSLKDRLPDRQTDKQRDSQVGRKIDKKTTQKLLYRIPSFEAHVDIWRSYICPVSCMYIINI